MKLKVLIKLSSVFILMACAKATSPNKGHEQETPVSTVVDAETDRYATFDCASVPTRDWVGDPDKSKAFLKMVILKLNKLNINGNYSGFDNAKSECQVSINTASNSLDIITNNNLGVELNDNKKFLVQGFSCSESKVRYDLIFENTTNGSTKYLSLLFSPQTQDLNKVYFNTQSIHENNSIFECNYLKQASF